MPITLHANGELFQSGAPHIRFFQVCNNSGLQMVMVVATLSSKASSTLLNGYTYRCFCDLLDEESVSGESRGRASL